MLSNPRFAGRYNTMIVTLLRPSPQVPKPSPRSALLCYDASTANIRNLNTQMATAMVDITWIFVLTLFQAVNTILWSISYPEVRALHTKDELEENIEKALDIIIKCRERWPGTSAASELYSKLAKACLRSYDVRDSSHPPSLLSANSPSSLTDANSPSASEHSSATTSSLAFSQPAYHSPPQFRYVFDQMPEPITQNYDYNSMPPPQPSFRSGSIFAAPSSMQTDRRFSYFPPDFTQPQNLPNAWNPINSSSQPPMSGPPPQIAQQPVIADPSYFMQPTAYAMGGSSVMFGDLDYDTEMRQGSLSYEQQMELMASLEEDGLTEIDNLMNFSAGYENSLKI
jgi:hypothetical protein